MCHSASTKKRKLDDTDVPAPSGPIVIARETVESVIESLNAALTSSADLKTQDNATNALRFVHQYLASMAPADAEAASSTPSTAVSFFGAAPEEYKESDAGPGVK